MIFQHHHLGLEGSSLPYTASLLVLVGNTALQQGCVKPSMYLLDICSCLRKLTAESSFASDGSRAGLLNIEISLNIVYANPTVFNWRGNSFC